MKQNEMDLRGIPLTPPSILKSLAYEINRSSERRVNIEFTKQPFGDSLMYSLRLEYFRSRESKNKAYGGGETAVTFGEDYILSDDQKENLDVSLQEHETRIRDLLGRNMMINIAKEGLESKWQIYNEQPNDQINVPDSI